jgi:site-specific recombinase XerD
MQGRSKRPLSPRKRGGGGAQVLNDALEAYVDWLEAGAVSQGTIRLRLHHLTRFGANADLENASAEDIIGWLQQPGWKPETRKSYRASLRSFYQWLHKTGRRGDDPTIHTRPIKSPPRVHKTAPREAIDAALAKAKERDALAVMLAAFAGLRRAEIAGMHASMIYPKHIVIRGKGGRERKIPIHPKLEPMLRDAQARGGYLFPNVDGGPVTADAMGRRIARLLPEGLSAHALRHHFATEVYRNTHDIRATQALLGHSSIATTEIYVATDDDALAAAVGTLAS